MAQYYAVYYKLFKLSYGEFIALGTVAVRLRARLFVVPLDGNIVLKARAPDGITPVNYIYKQYEICILSRIGLILLFILSSRASKTFL